MVMAISPRVAATTLLISATQAYLHPRIWSQHPAQLSLTTLSASIDHDGRTCSPFASTANDDEGVTSLLTEPAIDEEFLASISEEAPVSMTIVDEILPTLAVLAVVLGWLFWSLLRSDLVDSMDTMPLDQRLAVLRTVSWFPSSGSGGINNAEVIFTLVMAASAFAQALTGFGATALRLLEQSLATKATTT